MLNHQAQNIYRMGDVVIDICQRTVHVKGVEIAFTHKEFNILHFFVAHRRWALSKQQILDAVWSSQCDANYHAVENAIYRIRQKLGNSDTVKIQTMIGYGYKLVLTDDTDIS